MAAHAAGERFAGLHVLVDDDPRWPRDPVAQARAACAGGAPVVQLRAKHATDATALAWAREIRALTRACGTLFVMNDRFDLALASDADAVHLGQEDLPPERIPSEARQRLAVGRSTHDLEQARKAADEPIDYVAFGPLFGTRSKDSPYAARGIEALRAVVDAVQPKPVIAIGGINGDNLAEVLRAGAAGAAVISAAAGAADAEAAVRELARHGAWPGRAEPGLEQLGTRGTQNTQKGEATS
ncbi:MAG: thiamine phosphate synthase [Deltaproteobacteria bacterium]|nr:thiamine phosphate synthase [Deltaproteobacteria bacterium]